MGSNEARKVRNVSTVIGWMFGNSRGFRSRIVIASLIGVLYIAIGLSFVWVSKLAIDSATGDASYSLWKMGALLALLMLTSFILSAIQIWLKDVSVVEFQNQLRAHFMSRLLYEPWKGRERMHTGDMLNRLEQDVKDLVTLYIDTVPTAFITIVQFVASFLFLLFLDSKLALAILLIMPFFIVISKVYFFKMRRLNKETRSNDSRIQSLIQETMQHRMVAKALCLEGITLKRLFLSQDSLLSQTKTKTRFSAFSRIMVMLGFSTGYIVTFLWGTHQLQMGIITFGVMTAFLQLVGQVQRPVFEMARIVPTVITAFTAAERLMELQDAPQEEKVGTRQLNKGDVGIRLENISFSYEEGSRNIYDNYSYDFKPGSFTVIEGETGSGKTTMVRLILALLQPNHGSAFLYGDGWQQSASSQTRPYFSYIPQGNTLFSGTIRENLLLVNPNATESEMREALHVAAADFVLSLPKGLDSLCGELGSGLSEGQAQRIAIARSLLSTAPVFLIDEATSALDEETEKIFLERFAAFRKKRTVIFITHRKSVFSICDDVLSM
jgi:ABC-type bacteriocin/lantibiotic exporter with double-glycine peptidase domain